MNARRHRVDDVADVGLSNVQRHPPVPGSTGAVIGHGVWVVTMRDGRSHRLPELGNRSEPATDPGQFCRALIERMTGPAPGPDGVLTAT